MIEQNLQTLIFFRKYFSKIFEIFWKHLKIFDFFLKNRFFKIENFRRISIENFRKNFGKFRKFFKLWRFFSIKNFANFLMNFFLNLIRNIWFIRIIEPFSTIPRCVYMRWHRVRLRFSLFLTPNHQKRTLFCTNLYFRPGSAAPASESNSEPPVKHEVH